MRPWLARRGLQRPRPGANKGGPRLLSFILAPPGVATSSFFISHAARAQKHEKRRRPCSPESWVNHQCQPARSCERFTMCGLGWERICRVLSHPHFVALYARILILHTEHVRHRGGEQQQQQIVACADACEFVARLRGELREDEHSEPHRRRASNDTGQSS